MKSTKNICTGWRNSGPDGSVLYGCRPAGNKTGGFSVVYPDGPADGILYVPWTR